MMSRRAAPPVVGYAREPRPHVGPRHFKSGALGRGARAGFGDVDFAALDSRRPADREAGDRGHCGECPGRAAALAVPPRGAAAP